MEEQQASNKNLIHEMSGSKKSASASKGGNSSAGKSLLVVIVIMVILGLGTGYIAANVSGNANKGPVSVGDSVESGEIKQGTTVGVDDTEQFPDTAEGELKEGGIDGEGEYHLVRPGGDSQNVYLTSSAIDLSQFVGKKVKVQGATFEAEKAGWLMDVGRLEVL